MFKSMDEFINNKVKLRDGRALGYAEYGDTNGRSVFHFHGSGGSRLEHPSDLSILKKIEIRFISTDRPGHGISDPQPNRNLLGWADDISELANHLGIDKFYVMGHSAGGPYALACAYKLSDRIIACGIVSGLAPYSRPNPYKDLPFTFKLMMFTLRNFPKVNIFLRKQMAKVLEGNNDEIGKKLLSGFPNEDQAHLANPEYLDLLIKEIKEGYRQGSAGPALDDILINSPWGFDIEKIEVPTFIWHGKVDRNVPLSHGEYLNKNILSSELIILQDQAHLYIYSMWEKLLTKITSSKL